MRSSTVPVKPSVARTGLRAFPRGRPHAAEWLMRTAFSAPTPAYRVAQRPMIMAIHQPFCSAPLLTDSARAPCRPRFSETSAGVPSSRLVRAPSSPMANRAKGSSQRNRR